MTVQGSRAAIRSLNVRCAVCRRKEWAAQIIGNLYDAGDRVYWQALSRLPGRRREEGVLSLVPAGERVTVDRDGLRARCPEGHRINLSAGEVRAAIGTADRLGRDVFL